MVHNQTTRRECWHGVTVVAAGLLGAAAALSLVAPVQGEDPMNVELSSAAGQAGPPPAIHIDSGDPSYCKWVSPASLVPAPGEDPKEVEELIAGARMLRARFAADPQRPRYHFMPPDAWMNDINGIIYWKGRYHLFYQHQPLGALHSGTGGRFPFPSSSIHWGHASSVDLVHWVHHPIALARTPDGPDQGGCWSGHPVEGADEPTLIYYGSHGLPGGFSHQVVGDEPHCGACIATSRDDDLLTWIKFPQNPVIRNETFAEHYRNYEFPFFQDMSGWKQGDSYYALAGSREIDPAGGSGGGGDVARLLKSPDLVHWEYLGPFYTSERRWTEPGEDCACPQFFPLGEKHVLLFISHHRGAQYYIGRFEDEQFYPERHARMNWPGGCFLPASTILDEKGRRLMFAWMAENRMTDVQRASGWSGVMTMPRVLTLGEDGNLRIDPVPELEILRYNHRSRKGLNLSEGSELVLEEIRGDCLELAVEMRPGGARQFGVNVRCSPRGEERTRIVCDVAAGTLSVDFSKSSLDGNLSYPEQHCPGGGEPYAGTPRAQVAPFELKPGEPLKLRVFLDRSVLEVYANSRQCVTQRIYPTRSDSLDVSLFASDGDVEVRSVDAWDMHGIR